MEHSPVHYVQIDETLCNGCVRCMQACANKAIRIRDEKARIEGICIDCGNCIRVCERRAIKASTAGSDALKLSRFTIVSVSPVLYSQFGEHVMPNDILLALRRVFNHVYDQSYTMELFNVATELYIKENRNQERAPWPLISPICPVVNRIITYRFPELYDHILPILTPREIAARELKKRFYDRTIFKPEEIGVYHVTPCSAKMISIKEPVLANCSYLDGAVGINEIYDVVLKNLSDVEGDVVLHRSGGVGLGWAHSGGEIAGLESGNYLAVSGIEETIRYLEKIEMGLLRDIEYVEFRACPEGCIGGLMTAADKYQAKRTVQRLVRTFGIEKRVKVEYASKLYQEGWFFCEEEMKCSPRVPTPRLSISDAIRRQEKVEKILRNLPGKECGLCGSPDCRTFAEDVVDGRNRMENCICRLRPRNEEFKGPQVNGRKEEGWNESA